MGPSWLVGGLVGGMILPINKLQYIYTYICQNQVHTRWIYTLIAFAFILDWNDLHAIISVFNVMHMPCTCRC